MRPASLVAWRCASLKYAGTVTTASVTRLAELGLGVGLQLLEDHRGDLRRRVLLAVGLHAGVAVRAGDDAVGDDRHLLRHLGRLAAHEALDGEDGVLGVRDRLALGRRADEPLPVLRERDDGRRGAPALGVLEHGRIAAFEDGHARVRRAEIDADDSAHGGECSSWFGGGADRILGYESLSIKFSSRHRIYGRPPARRTGRSSIRRMRRWLLAALVGVTLATLSSPHPRRRRHARADGHQGRAPLDGGLFYVSTSLRKEVDQLALQHVAQRPHRLPAGRAGAAAEGHRDARDRRHRGAREAQEGQAAGHVRGRRARDRPGHRPGRRDGRRDASTPR